MVTRGRFDFVAGNLALDFVNTAQTKLNGVPNDPLNSYVGLVNWARAAKLLGKREAVGMLASGEGKRKKSARVLERAQHLRAALYKLITPGAGSKSVDSESLKGFNEELSRTLKHLGIRTEGGAYAWGLEDSDEPSSILWPVTREAAHLLTSKSLSKVRQCASPECSLVYLDTTKNHSRVWCSMKTCGNRAKVQKYRALRKA